MQKELHKYDKMGIGFVSGLILPVLVFLIIYLVGNNDVSFFKFIKSMWQVQALVKLGSLCVFMNVALFWIFLFIKYEKAARGVLAITILYALAVVFTKIV